MPAASISNDAYAANQGAALASFWLPRLKPLSWPERLKLLDHIHEQVQDEFKDLTLYCEVFPIFIAQIVDALGEGDVRSLEQAHIYANSAEEAHRQMAGRWLSQNRQGRKNH